MKKLLCIFGLVLAINTSFAPKKQEVLSTDQEQANIRSLAEMSPRPSQPKGIVPLLKRKRGVAKRKGLLQPKRLFVAEEGNVEDVTHDICNSPDLTLQ